MSDNAANLATLPEPEWIPWGDGGFRLNGTNWVIRPLEKLVRWYVFCGYEYFDDFCDLGEAKLSALELRRLMA